MGIERDINCIFHNSKKETMNILKEEIMSISSESKNTRTNSIHNYAFCRYHDYKVITEKMHVLIYPYTIIFLWSPVAVVLFLDNKLHVNGGDSGELQPEDSLMFDFIDLPNIDYLGTVFNNKGELFEAFTIKDKMPKDVAKRLFKNLSIRVDEISMKEDDLIHISMEFLTYQIEKFEAQIEASLSSEDAPHPALDENPFANKYYDHDILPIEEKKPLGDQRI